MLPSCIGSIINHYKDPYETSSIMESKRVLLVAQLILGKHPKTFVSFHMFSNLSHDFHQKSLLTNQGRGRYQKTPRKLHTESLKNDGQKLNCEFRREGAAEINSWHLPGSNPKRYYPL